MPNYVAYEVASVGHGVTQLPVAVVDWYMRHLVTWTDGTTPTLLVSVENMLLVARLARGLPLGAKCGVGLHWARRTG